ncbi:MAG: formylglycine-generating enzyme family protein [Verrucomicrobiales bacterium]|nr:formylglycine-generating enzyme family protein [Verrucomicrobiales bacterium]
MRIIALLLVLSVSIGICEEPPPLPGDDFDMVQRLHKRAVNSAKTSKLIDYTFTYDSTDPEPKTNEIEMVAIKGGTFTMGSKGRGKPDESPPHKVRVSPFWMGKYEVTWDLYEPFMFTRNHRNRYGSPTQIPPGADDAFVVSKPTTPYTEMSFGMGVNGYPAINMTQHAASKFCQWLSAKTGHFYRLPTEAEWEYACRAGTTGPFSCPQGKIHEYAVCEPNINNPLLVGYAPVGTKKPNPWGLYDMHGNVMEWCLDQYNSLTYRMRPQGRDLIVDPWIRANRVYPRVARGGSWYDPPEDCTSTVRYFSDPDWKMADPQLPKSIWYHTDAHWLGFRIVRPFEIPSAEKMDTYWNSAHPDRIEKEESENE